MLGTGVGVIARIREEEEQEEEEVGAWIIRSASQGGLLSVPTQPAEMEV